MDNCEKAQKSIAEAATLIREKSPDSTLVERYFLLYEAWDMVEDLPQALQMGKGLYYVLSKASLPIKDYDLLLGRYDDHVPTDEEQEKLENLWERNPDYNPIVFPNGGHRTLDWETLLNKGITGYISDVKCHINKAESDGEEQNTIDFLEGMLWVYKGILLYIERYGEAARKKGFLCCAQICENLIKDKPKTFHEALQLLLFIYNIYLIYAGKRVACLTLGRLDDMLLHFYENDLKTGILTEEDAGALIDDFSAKMSLHLGRGEHQMAFLDKGYVQTGWLRNPVYDSPGYIVLGGYSNKIDHKTNPLTLLFAKHIHPELKNPIYVCRYTSNCYDELWNILCEKVQKNASLLLYNDETMIPAYTHIGVEKQDAVNYSIHPCNWADIAGDSVIVGICGKPLPVILDQVLNSGKEFKNIDEVYAEIKKEYTSLLKPTFENYRKNNIGKKTVSNGILSLDDCFAKEIISAARGLKNGGAKYPALYVLLRNIGTATDMLCAVDALVFKDKVYTLSQLLEAAKNDFEGFTDILAFCRKAPKYGTDNDFADMHASRLMNELLDVIDKEATNEHGKRDVYTLNVTINDSNHLKDGANMLATVDGRRKGKPLSENLGPTVGYSKGITALLNSVSKLPFDRIHSGALNLRLRKNTVADEKGLSVIKALIQAYFERGGMQLQISIADTEELKKAQQNPDEYRDLLVRITGYSAIFVDMSKGAQNEFIRREELQ